MPHCLSNSPNVLADLGRYRGGLQFGWPQFPHDIAHLERRVVEQPRCRGNLSMHRVESGAAPGLCEHDPGGRDCLHGTVVETEGQPAQLLLQQFNRPLGRHLRLLQCGRRLRGDTPDDANLLRGELVPHPGLVDRDVTDDRSLVHQRDKEDYPRRIRLGDRSVGCRRVRQLVVQHGRPSTLNGLTGGLAQSVERNRGAVRCRQSPCGDLRHEHTVPHVDQVDEHPRNAGGIEHYARKSSGAAHPGQTWSRSSSEALSSTRVRASSSCRSCSAASASLRASRSAARSWALSRARATSAATCRANPTSSGEKSARNGSRPSEQAARDFLPHENGHGQCGSQVLCPHEADVEPLPPRSPRRRQAARVP